MLKWAAWPRGVRWLAGGIAAAVLVLALAWVLFGPAADWLAHQDVGSATGPLLQTARDSARGWLLTLGAGLLAGGVLVFAARALVLLRRGQVTDRYTKAIEQLASTELDVRIGGIYALEGVARDSARDHPMVMEVLTTFVREHSREQWPPPDAPRTTWITWRGRFRTGGRQQERFTRPDVQAAVIVLGRRDAGRDIQRIHLNGADLTRARLFRTDLTRANLGGATLTEATLTGAKWPGGSPVPDGWKLDRAGRLVAAAGTDAGSASLRLASCDMPSQ